MISIKKMLSCLTVCLVMMSPATSITVFAQDSEELHDDEVNSNAEAVIDYKSECRGDCGYGISHLPLEEQLEDFLKDPNRSEESKQATKEKIQKAISFRDSYLKVEREENLSNTYYPEITIGVPSYTQINGYYCGPATTRQSLKYLSYVVPGEFAAPSQTSIASSIGTTTSGTEWYRIRNYLNSYTFAGITTDYIEYVPSNSDNMTSVLYLGITETNPEPPILQVDTNGDTSILGYSTGGHYLNASGIKTESGINKIQLTDPNRARVGLSSKYYITSANAYTITNNHWASHFLY